MKGATVSKAELQKVLAKLAVALKSRRRKAPAIVWSTPGKLHLLIENVWASIEADGEAGGAVFVHSQYLVGLAKALPKTDPLPIIIEGDSLTIGSFTLTGAACPVPDSGQYIQLKY